MRIAGIGIELEGIFGTELNRMPEPWGGGSYIGDASMKNTVGFDKKQARELRSPVLHLDNINDPLLKNWLEKNYPVKSNYSCGMHVHASFRNYLDYVKLTHVNFWDLFQEEMKDLGEALRLPASHLFYRRLAGEALGDHDKSYCQPKFRPELQVGVVKNWEAENMNALEARYSQLNYCYAHLKTIECRLFPVFETWERAYKAIITLLNLYEKYLDSDPPIEHTFLEESTITDEVDIIEDCSVLEFAPTVLEV